MRPGLFLAGGRLNNRKEGTILKQKIIGSYFIGYESVELSLNDGSGGGVFFVEEGSIARMKLGGDQDWDSCFASLLHETFELVFDRIKCRFVPCNDMGKSAGSFLFVADHVAFSDVCAKSAEFIDACLPDLKREYEIWNEKKEVLNEAKE